MRQTSSHLGRWRWIAGVFVLLWSMAASAQDQERARAPLPGREVERGLLTPKGWVQSELSLSRSTISPTGSAGEWRSQHVTLQNRIGLLPRLTLQLDLNVQRLGAVQPSGLTTGQTGFVDPVFGMQWSVFAQEPPGRWLALHIWTKTPAGPDGAGNGVAISTGTPDLGLGLQSRLRWAVLRNDLALEGLYRIAGVSHVFTTESGGAGLLKPGHELQIRDQLLLQMGPLLGAVDGDLALRSASRQSPGFSVGSRRLSVLEGTQGVTVNLGWRAGFQVSRGAEVWVFGRRTLLATGIGRDGLQSWVPAPSRTLGLSVQAAL